MSKAGEGTRASFPRNIETLWETGEFRGLELHQWVEAFARSNKAWIHRRKVRVTAPMLPKKPVVSAPWIAAGTWSNEDARHVQRLMHLARHSSASARLAL